MISGPLLPFSHASRIIALTSFGVSLVGFGFSFGFVRFIGPPL
jgi:hypothetical protein